MSLVARSLEPQPASRIAPLLREHARLVVEEAQRVGSSWRELDGVQRIFSEHFPD